MLKLFEYLILDGQGEFLMSSSYYIYTEGFIDGHWNCLDSFLPVDGTYEMVETYRNQSRTYFQAAYEKLREIGYETEFSKLSISIQEKAMHEAWDNVLVADLQAMRRILPRIQKTEHHGYIEKSQLFMLESREASAIEEWITVKEYSALDVEAKKSYQYYEWNDEFGWYEYFLLIVERVDWQISNWNAVHFNSEIESIRIIISVL